MLGKGAGLTPPPNSRPHHKTRSQTVNRRNKRSKPRSSHFLLPLLHLLPPSNLPAMENRQVAAVEEWGRREEEREGVGVRVGVVERGREEEEEEEGQVSLRSGQMPCQRYR